MPVTSKHSDPPSRRAGRLSKQSSSSTTSPRRSSRLLTKAQEREDYAPLAITPSKGACEPPQQISCFTSPPGRSPRHLIREHYALASTRRARKRPKQRRLRVPATLNSARLWVRDVRDTRFRPKSRLIHGRPEQSLPLTAPLLCGPRRLGTTLEQKYHVPAAIAPYRYKALNKEAFEIRLMTLLPGVFGSKIRVTIQNDVLSETQTPTYEALSYAWGSNQKTVNVFVQEMKGDFTLAVTSNLAEALQYLRYENTARVLWIDAVCVDQQNVRERGHQVSRMADIYRVASPVIIWLGPGSPSNSLAMQELSALGSTITVDWATTEITPLSGEEYHVWKAEPWPFEHIPSLWTSIESLLNRPWFKRLWIWQEVRLARNGAVILCGNETMQWEVFRKATWCIGLKPGSWSSEFHKLALRVSDICYYSGPLSSLANILQKTKDCQYSDPRDRVFAILNLTHRYDVTGLEADYSKSTEEVFQSVILNYLSTRGTLDILSHCELKEPKAIKVPSWVPDWTVPNECEPLLGSKACWGSKAQARFDNEGVLRVTARCVATIEEFHSLRLDLVDKAFFGYEFSLTARRLMVRLREFFDTYPNESIEDAFCRTLHCNRFSESYLPHVQGLPHLQESRVELLRIIDAIGHGPESDLYNRSSIDSIITLIKGRVFFTTKERHIGLAPCRIEPGDQVCIVLGCQSPLVLRRNKFGDHTVIGECYLHGVMDGAGLLGMLPSNWQRVDRYVSNLTYYYDAFINHETGEVQVEDPRLGPLPPGWRIANHTKKHVYNRYSNEATGKFKTHLDPRMRPEALIARGINLQEFRLV